MEINQSYDHENKTRQRAQITANYVDKNSFRERGFLLVQSR